MNYRKKNKDKKVNVRIAEDVWKTLQDHEINISLMVRELIDKELKNESFNRSLISSDGRVSRKSKRSKRILQK